MVAMAAAAMAGQAMEDQTTVAPATRRLQNEDGATRDKDAVTSADLTMTTQLLANQSVL
jgi:hypothetical protein